MNERVKAILKFGLLKHLLKITLEKMKILIRK